MMGEDEAGFTFLAENSAEIVCRAGLDLAFRYASPSMSQVLGWLPAEIVGKSLRDFVSADDAEKFAAAPGAAHAPALEKAPVVLRLQKKDGSLLWMEIRRRLLLAPETAEPREYILHMRGLEEAKMQTELVPANFARQIPGLSSPGEFMEDLQRECSRAQREGTPLSLLRLDFNGFRQFHFLDGHRVGDGCLGRAAAAVKAAVRVTDFAAHYLAEDMAVLLPATNYDGAANVARKIRSAIHALRSPRSLEGQAWVAVSVGMASLTVNQGGGVRLPEVLLLAAEHALQKAQQEEAESLRHIAAHSARSADWKKSMPGHSPRCA